MSHITNSILSSALPAEIAERIHDGGGDLTPEDIERAKDQVTIVKSWAEELIRTGKPMVGRDRQTYSFHDDVTVRVFEDDDFPRILQQITETDKLSSLTAAQELSDMVVNKARNLVSEKIFGISYEELEARAGQ